MNTYFYNGIAKTKLNATIVDYLESYAEENLTSVYILHSPLGTNYQYDYSDAAIVLIPHYKIIAMDWGQDETAFKEYFDDLLEDLGYISDKYGYKNIIGRKKVWQDALFCRVTVTDDINFSEVLKSCHIEDKDQVRLCQLIISLLTGSINDIKSVGKESPTDVLDAVKRRIVLYDAKQTDFIFSQPAKKIVRVQGLAGTGKTELLLRKLKELYTDNSYENSKIVMACFNRILASDLKKRIPDFFDFLKVEEQIKWDSSLFIMRGWGSSGNKNSGVYSYICAYYKLDYLPFSYTTSFDNVCTMALEALNQKVDFSPCFDYMLIDESQDFPNSFISLCDKVTRKQIYLAGDVFQNIFDTPDTEVEPDFLLNNCYRTEPKTLIFAHALGMGIIDANTPDKYLRWLSDKEWKMCGYEISRANDTHMFQFSRMPLNRFDDVDTSKVSSVIVKQKPFEEYEKTVIQWIRDIKNEYPSVLPSDIGIVFLENENDNYKLIDSMASTIYSEFGWNVNRGYVNKTKIKGEIFVSNIYNVKGLEFSFVICISKNKLSTSTKRRNAMYMILTRSFISSYFLISDSNGDDVFNLIDSRLDCIMENGYLEVEEPSKERQEKLRQTIISSKNINKSQKEIASEIMEQINIPLQHREKIHKSLETLLEDDETDVSTITEVIKKLNEILL